MKMEDNLNFKAADFTTKTSKTNGVDTIEIDLVQFLIKVIIDIILKYSCNHRTVTTIAAATSIIHQAELRHRTRME